MENVPKHIGIIMDGNRRFAKRLMIKPWKGHEWGKDKVEKLLDWCKDLSIKEVTLYAFSIQNFNRPKTEFAYILKLFTQAANQLLIDPRIEKYSIKVRFIGRLELFPTELTSIMHQVMDKTENNTGFVLNLAMAYGGREEIIDAVRLMGADIKSGKIDAKKINEKLFSQYLYLKDEPDLIIRTGGEKRMSNFLPWQSVYAELIFIDKMWPEFEKEDLIICIEEYKSRERRFGR